MVRTKLDNRIRVLIENGVSTGHRSMFVIVGDKGRDQVVILHHILSKAIVAARPSVLWCYKKELGFSSSRKKRIRELKKNIRSGRKELKDDPFELFVSSTHIRYCYYSETHKILGNTYGMLVLQDFEAITPNLLARTMETVEGGGIIVVLLNSVNSLKQLYAMTMDVHKRYRTESHSEIVPRFNERFILSLATCRYCAVVDDRLNVLPLSSHITKLKDASMNSKKEAENARNEEMESLKTSLSDTKPIGPLLNKCKTLCQAKALLRLLDVITEKNPLVTCSVTAARGRGKSAALGLAIAGAIGFGYSNIFVTSPSPDNLKTLFEFVIKGFNVMGLEEHTDFELMQSTNKEFSKAIVRINVFRDHRQIIQYIDPRDAIKLSQAELVVIDEAAAIPLPLVKDLISGHYIAFLASTLNGYEGTGRSLSLKLLQQLREQAAGLIKNEKNERQLSGFKGRMLHEITLEESIRYKPGDQVESWLNRVLCLDATNSHTLITGMPSPQDCELLYVNRDTLFSFHNVSEIFLHHLMAIYVSAHYKNSPNDLQLLSDAPAHHIFVLVPPINDIQANIPQIIAVVQVCLEGSISETNIRETIGRGKRAAGDLLPWSVSQQFLDENFPTLVGGRIIRIAVHPDYQSMGYGSQALKLLQSYYEGTVSNLCENDVDMDDSIKSLKNIEDTSTLVLLEEVIQPRTDLPSLLSRLTERRPERLDYLGVSYGLTLNLLKFWKRSAFVPVYLRQTANELTGEYSCIMLKQLHDDEDDKTGWLSFYWKEFRRRIIRLFAFEFSKFSVHLALSILQIRSAVVVRQTERKLLNRLELDCLLTNSDLRRLSQYARNMINYHLINDLTPTLAQLYFEGRLDKKVKLNAIQQAILLAVGLQHKTINMIIAELDIPANQVLALFNKAICKISEYFDEICVGAIKERADGGEDKVAPEMHPIQISLEKDLNEAAEEVRKRDYLEEVKASVARNMKQYAIKGSEDEWKNALSGIEMKTAKRSLGIISVKSDESKERRETNPALLESENKLAGRKRKRKSFKDH